MPKDEWFRVRQRDVAKRAAREFATGSARSFEWIFEDPPPSILVQ